MIYEGSTLYGFTHDANSEVISINTSTGAGSFLYNTSGAGTITSLTDILPASVPEPSTAVLAGIACVTGITANGWRRRKVKLDYVGGSQWSPILRCSFFCCRRSELPSWRDRNRHRPATTAGQDSEYHRSRRECTHVRASGTCSARWIRPTGD